DPRRVVYNRPKSRTMLTERVDAVVVGAGVVGLAVARALALAGREVIVLESESTIGTGTSSRNSEVIHAGIYYPPGSLKARLCVLGNRLLYELCAERGVPHRRCGKVLTAVEQSEVPALEALRARARDNGVELQRLSAAEVHDLEPHVSSVGGLLSPDSGIVSAHGLMDVLLHAVREAGAVFQPRAELAGLERGGGDY